MHSSGDNFSDEVFSSHMFWGRVSHYVSFVVYLASQLTAEILGTALGFLPEF